MVEEEGKGGRVFFFSPWPTAPATAVIHGHERLRRWLGVSKYRDPKLNLDAGYELSANYQDVFQVIHGINHVTKKKKETKKRKQQQQQHPTPPLDKDSKVELKAWEY